MIDGSHNPVGDPAADDEVGRLLRKAGMRQDPPADRAERVRRVVLDECRAVARARRRRQQFVTGSVVLAAAALLLIAVRLRTPAERGRSRRLSSHPSPPSIASQERSAVSRGQGRSKTLPPAAGDTLRADESLETGAEGRVSVLAGADVSVRLDAASRIRFRSAGDIVLERGTVYVDNQAGSDHVSVHTPLGVVRDIGTQYEVRLERTG